MPDIYLAFAIVFCGIMFAYLVRGGMGLNTCAGWVVLTSIHGLLVKPLFVYFDFPSAELLDIVLFEKVSRADYWYWGTIALIPYALFFASMVLVGRYSQRVQAAPRTARVRYFSNAALMMFLALAFTGMIGFFLQFPQLLGSVNKNAVASTDLADYNGGGIWRILIEVSYFVSLCSIANIGARVARHRSVAVFALSAGLWLSFCYLSDQRGAMLFSMITYLIAYNRYVAHLSKTSIVSAVSITFALVVARTMARLQVDGASAQETLAGTISNFVGQNLIEHGKTITIIKSIPDLLGFQYGFTYLNAILALVPRSIFPDKSAVNLDTTIGNKVFDCGAFGACGVPPGLLAESYLNFGVFGLILMPIFTGLLVGALDARFRTSERGSPFDVFFLYSLLYLGMAFLGSGLSSPITALVTQSITVAVISYFCSRTARPGVRWVTREASWQPRNLRGI